MPHFIGSNLLRFRPSLSNRLLLRGIRGNVFAEVRSLAIHLSLKTCLIPHPSLSFDFDLLIPDRFNSIIALLVGRPNLLFLRHLLNLNV